MPATVKCQVCGKLYNSRYISTHVRRSHPEIAGAADPARFEQKSSSKSSIFSTNFRRKPASESAAPLTSRTAENWSQEVPGLAPQRARSGCPDLIGRTPPAPPLPGTFSGTLSERVASRLHWFPASGPRQCRSHPPTSPLPYLVASLPPYTLFSKLFSCNIYEAPSCVLQTKDLLQAYLPTKPFRCNTYKKRRGRVVSGLSMFQRCFIRVSSTYLLSFHILAHSLARRKLNPFVFRRFRTLCQKHPGWGYPSLCGNCVALVNFW